MLKRSIKYLLALGVYAFLILEGFIGGEITNKKDIWKNMESWINNFE